MPLKPPMGSSRPSRAAARVGGGAPVPVEGPARGEVQPLLVVDAHLAVGGGAEGGVVDDRELLAGRDGDGQRVDPQQALRARPRGPSWAGRWSWPGRSCPPGGPAWRSRPSPRSGCSPARRRRRSPSSRARSIARPMAKWAPICPMLFPPSTTRQAPAWRTTAGRPWGSTPPAVSFRTYSGTRSTPCECTPRRSALTRVSASRAASSGRIPQRRKTAPTRSPRATGSTRRSVSFAGYVGITAPDVVVAWPGAVRRRPVRASRSDCMA